MRITVEIDTSGFDQAADGLLRGPVAAALADGVNAAAERVREHVREGMRESFDRPSPWTLGGVGMFKARPSPVRAPDAVVFLRSGVEWYLQKQIEGGSVEAGDRGAMSFGVLVPGPDAILDSFGNLPRDLTARPDTTWIDFDGQGGLGPALVRRLPGGLELLAYAVDRAEYEPRFDFYGLVAEVAGDYLVEEVQAALAAATRA
ncbi:hypothetical protein [Salinarimonas rosea]|uniref:hypothetical protein n=1 Tax=Salinarimonas rosea TaxID=552063 RepID=UPI0004152A08|nr:hypothetical protein [Salinarimonas rosea]